MGADLDDDEHNKGLSDPEEYVVPTKHTSKPDEVVQYSDLLKEVRFAQHVLRMHLIE